MFTKLLILSLFIMAMIRGLLVVIHLIFTNVSKTTMAKVHTIHLSHMYHDPAITSAAIAQPASLPVDF